MIYSVLGRYAEYQKEKITIKISYAIVFLLFVKK